MRLSVIREEGSDLEGSDLEGSDSKKPPAEQPTSKAISIKLLSDEGVPSNSTSCFDCLRVIMESLRRENRI